MVMGETMNALWAEKSKILNIPDTHIMNILVILNILLWARLSIYSIFSHCQYGRYEYLALGIRRKTGPNKQAPFPFISFPRFLERQITQFKHIASGSPAYRLISSMFQVNGHKIVYQ